MFYQTQGLQSQIRAIRYSYQHGVAEALHQHCVMQLLHIIQGVIRVYAQDRCWVVPPSRGLLIPAGVQHRLVTVGQVEVRTLFIDPIARADLSNELGIFQVSPLLRELINTATEFSDHVVANSRESRIHELILDELRLLRFCDFHVAMPISKDLNAFCQRVATHLARPWELADVAAALDVSVRTISRRFQLETGMSFAEWLRRLRLLKSMELLASGYSVTHAALVVGYDSPSAFSIMFKNRIGISPNLYVAQPSLDDAGVNTLP